MTFCIAIHAELKIPACPLEKGKCYWQHSDTRVCTFTTDELTLDQFCQRVGLKEVPNQEQIERFVTNLKAELQP